MRKSNQFEVGDWVKGKSKNGELIRGYIEDTDSYHGVVKVTVVESDNAETIGKTVETPSSWVEKLPIASYYNEEQIRDVIDVALASKDEVWFMELTEKLKAFKQGSSGNGQRFVHDSTLRNRLGTSGLK
ncbi:IDEAL domain-containing protein [Ammoniphilus sp. 3BR4]|uniref:IDEAL domain-containing protein n=1 Tax=Ammoniphilus sp. 3BR4 TaxID=3158265 RepID=UPI0034673178